MKIPFMIRPEQTFLDDINIYRLQKALSLGEKVISTSQTIIDLAQESLDR